MKTTKHSSEGLATRLFAVVVIFLLIAFGLGFYVAASIVRISVYSHLNAQLDRVLIEAGRSTIEIKEFLMNAYTDEEFVSKGTNSSFREFKSAIDSAGVIINKLSRVEILIDNAEERKSIEALESSLLQYKQNLQLISDLFRKKGFKDLGVEGEMRRSIHFIENYPISTNKVLLLTLRRHEKDFLLRKDMKYVDKFNADLQIFKDEISTDQRLNDTQKAELIQKLMQYQAHFMMLVDIEKQIGLTPKEGIRQSITENYHNFKHHLNELGDEVRAEQHALRVQVNVILVVMSLLFLTLLLAAVLSLRYFIRQISVPLKKLNEYSERIAKGNLSLDMTGLKSSELIRDVVLSFENLIDKLRLTIRQIEDISARRITTKLTLNNAHDEIGHSLNKIIDQIAQFDAEEAQRKWLGEGLTRFSEIIRRSLRKDDLCKTLVSEIVKYVGANQAGIFLVNEEAQILHLQAAYAYNRNKFIKKDIPCQEGLLGQVYLDKDKIFLTEVPENYLQITSGLGTANPRCVVIVPFIHNEKVKAVLEIASFKILSDFEVQFLEKIGEMVASAIETTDSNERTLQLLELSRQKEEQLRNQEEEIRQNLEEMMATQEELNRIIREKDTILSELQQELAGYKKSRKIPVSTLITNRYRYSRRIEYFLDN